MLHCSNCDNRWFKDNAAWFQHCRDREDHQFCEQCDRLFKTESGLVQHTRAVHRDDDDEDSESDDENNLDLSCDTCNRDFVSKQSLFQHLAESSRHNWCFICSRDFANERALEQHSTSRVHKARDLKCPLCLSMFKIPSAIALHIEAGACHNISRHQVTAAVHSLKIAPTISLSHRLTQGPSTTIINYQATERAFNASANAYECYLCHRTFHTLQALNQHLGSPAHDQDEFKCPKCKRTYKLISGLIQHIESEVCGLAKFKRVEDEAHELMMRFMRALKL
ncbi:hypothetical protein FRB93_001059 [Tulasnella sp. JGI-2019a]|nr:hypothetical protein FRB93_001059 [Tulasnella sp. JGI-2019a]